MPGGAGEGRLQIRIEISHDVISKVALSSTRPVGLSAALAGRELSAALNLLPRLFSLCGMAQTVAGLTAVETALGFTPAPPQIAARHILVAAEALEQTAWQLLLEGPRCIGVPPPFRAPETAAIPHRRPASATVPRSVLEPDWRRAVAARSGRPGGDAGCNRGMSPAGDLG
jgi:hypothetical protein